MISYLWVHRIAALASLILALLAAPRVADASQPNWPQTPYSYLANGEALSSVLGNFAVSVGASVQVSKKIKGTVTGQFQEASPIAFLDRLASTYGLIWFYEAGTLWVYQADEVQRRTFRINAASADGLKQALDEFGLLDARYKLSISASDGIVIASGPPRYVERVSAFAASFAPQAQNTPKVGFRVYRLRYAKADDRTFVYRDKEITIPGVATILRGLVSGQTTGNVAGGARVAQLPPTVPSATGTAPGVLGYAKLPASLPLPPSADAASLTRADSSAAPTNAMHDAVIQADSRANAVIVRDDQSRLPIYDELIPLLDVPVAIVEIQAAIIEVSTTHEADLGIAWQAHISGAGTIGVGDLTNSTDLPQNAGQGVNLNLGTVNLATLATTQATAFLTRINLLEQTGDARLSSRPSILTNDNLEAVIDLSTTFYVKVAGTYAVDLFPVTTGVLLKVTPHVVKENGEHRVKLSLDIEDGSVDQNARDNVDGIPRITRNVVSTEAVVAQNHSLLIGGHYFETESANENKVPILGDIPVVGLLFKQKQKANQKQQRLFMITPRIVELPNG